MAATNLIDLLEGLDPSVMAEASGAQLLQLLRNATPSSDRAFLIWKDDLPTVAEITAMPRLKGYLSIKVTDNPKIVYGFDNTKFLAAENPPWSPVGIGNSAITNAMLAGGIQLSKLGIDPANPAIAGFFVIVNVTGDGFTFSEFELPDNSVDINKLDLEVGNELSLIRVKIDGSGWEFISPQDFASDIPLNSITNDKLAAVGINAGTIARLLFNEPTTDEFVLRLLAAADIAAAGVPDGQYLVTSGAKGGWSAISPSGALAIIQETTAVNVAGALTNATTWTSALLDVEIADVASLVTFSAGSFILIPGTYRIEAYISWGNAASTCAIKARLRNNTAGSIVVYSNQGWGNGGTIQLITPEIVCAVATEFSLQRYASSPCLSGQPLNEGANREVYCIVKIVRIS